MRVDVFTIFPGFFDSPLSASLLGRARERGLLDIRLTIPGTGPPTATGPSTTRPSAGERAW